MIAKCNMCDASIILPEDRAVIINCFNNCQLNCVFELDYTTYPHGEELQHWYIREDDNGEET